jgi:Protein of unknown function (DUF4232)
MAHDYSSPIFRHYEVLPMLATPPPRSLARGRRAVPLAMAMALAALAALLAGCGATTAPRSGTAPDGARTASGQQTAIPSAAGSGSRTAGSARSGTGGLTACRSRLLAVTVETAQAGAATGSAFVPVDFTNTSRTACLMDGYPGMSFVTAGNGAGRQIGAAAEQYPGFTKLAVRLTPGGVAHAWLQVASASSYPLSTCQPVTAYWLRVLPPGQTGAIYVSYAFAACGSAKAPLLFVMPVRGGKGIRGVTP